MAITRHVEWLMEGVESWNRRREERHFVPGLQKANLEGVDLSNVNLRGAQLRGAKLSNSNLSQSNLIGADLSRADLSNANLERATMTAAVVTNATLRGANLRYADISEIDLSRSDLSNTDMRNSFVLGANVKGTRFFNANVLSARSGHREHVDLSIVHGLVPGQLLEMNGDTGVVLPQGWAHPSHWPVLETNAEIIGDNSTGERFIFVSYASGDRALVEQVVSLIEEAGMKVWWDRDLRAGTSWREDIAARLQSSAAVLTLWTERSVASKPVIEEAAHAQRSRKLVHARLDDSSLPYGFSETQYADLRRWDGSGTHLEMRRLIQALRDRVQPPGEEEMRDRVISSAPVAAVLEDGLITAKDSPPNAKPPLQNPADLEARLEAQKALASKALGALQALDNNLGEAIRFDLAHFLEHISARPPSWYILTDSIDDIRFHLETDEDLSWPGSTRNTIENLCRGHEALRPLLQPVQPLAFSPEAPLLPPEPNPEKLSEQTLSQITKNASALFHSDDASKVLAEPALRAGDYLTVEIDEARNTPIVSESTAEKKLRKVRKSVLSLAGFVGTAIASITFGISGNLLTSAEAAKTLLVNLKRLFDSLISLF